MTIYQYKGPTHIRKHAGGQNRSLVAGHHVRIIGKTEHENVYKVQKVPGTTQHIVHANHLDPLRGMVNMSRGKASYKMIKKRRTIMKVTESMLSFKSFLNEALQPLPGKNKGWGD